MLRAPLLIALLAGTTAQMVPVSSHAAVPVVESTGTPATGSGSSYPSQTAQPQSEVRSYGTDPSQSEVRSYGVDQSPSTVAAAAMPSGSAGSGGTAELFMRFQQLEADVAQLRGQVEEQSHRLEQLEKQQKEQYLDLDKRIVALQRGQPAAAAAGDGAEPTTIAGPTTTGAAATPAAASSSLGERDAYNAAFELTKGRRFQQAIDAFNELLVKYPNGQYASNAYYWLGECYLALPEPNLEKARQSFMQVVNLYPTNSKVPDSLYKLGIVYHRLGDRSQALGYLDRVQAQFPGTRAAQLAQAYAAELR